MRCTACSTVKHHTDIDVEMEYNLLQLDTFKVLGPCDKCGLTGVGKDETGTVLMLIYKKHVDRVPAAEYFKQYASV